MQPHHQHITLKSCHSLQRLVGRIMMGAFQWRFFVLLIGFLNWNVVVNCADQSVNSLINLQKRIDYRTCIGRFDVHRDTIIQTEESRKLGATYLYHVEASNRDECLRVCCETDRCDVFVFEEKFQGSCFLFNCGPPDDFRCQFASHANYSIAVLAIPIQHYKDLKQAAPAPPPPAVAQTPHLSQHELELASLKTGRESFGSYRMPELGNKITGQQLQQPVVVTTAAAITTKTTTTQDPLLSKPSPCGRFQFQCKSGECLAIYNACDGIPQCEDGSDETPACPSQSQSSIPTTNNKKHISQMEEPPLYRVDSQLQPAQHRIDGDHGINYSDHPRQLYPGKMYEGSEVIGGYSSNAGSKFGQTDMTGSIEKPPPMGNREDRMSASRYYASAVNHQTIDGHQPSPQQQQQQPRNPTQIQLPNSLDNNNNMVYNMNEPDNRPLYDPHLTSNNHLTNSRPMDYYSGGGGGVVGPGNNNYRDKYYYPGNPNVGNQQQPQQGLGQNPAADGSNSNYPNSGGQINYLPAVAPNNNVNNNWQNSIVNNLPPMANLNNINGQAPQYQPQQLPGVSSSNKAAAANGVIAIPPANNEKPAKVAMKSKTRAKEEESEEEASQESAEETETSAPTTKKGKSRGKNRKLEKAAQENNEKDSEGMPTFPPIYQQLKAIGSELTREAVDHDGASDRPTGAVVSLVIGVFITAILAVFIGCRLKTVTRRIRRTGKGPYAHDADFLVNGMYL